MNIANKISDFMHSNHFHSIEPIKNKLNNNCNIMKRTVSVKDGHCSYSLW
jgi:hypothetical protein